MDFAEMLRKVTKVEECDATKAKQNYKSWNQNYFITNRMNEEIACLLTDRLRLHLARNYERNNYRRRSDWIELRLFFTKRRT